MARDSTLLGGGGQGTRTRVHVLVPGLPPHIGVGTVVSWVSPPASSATHHLLLVLCVTYALASPPEP